MDGEPVIASTEPIVAPVATLYPLVRVNEIAPSPLNVSQATIPVSLAQELVNLLYSYIQPV